MSNEKRVKHWRRRIEGVEGYACAGNVATACGRLVLDFHASFDPTEADCPECAVVRRALFEGIPGVAKVTPA